MSGKGKLWAGRFSTATDEEVELFNASIFFDWKMFEEDILGSAAHATMLAKIGVLTNDERISILSGLKTLLERFRKDGVPIDASYEDIHMTVESLLREEIGEVAGKLHTGRSRNDQVATDLHIFCRKKLFATVIELLRVQNALLTLARRYKTTILPGYTHLQRAQPVLFPFHCLTHIQRLGRDTSRMIDLFPRVNSLPLGAGALAGTTFPLDRQLTREILKFDSVYETAMDAVSDRDFLVEQMSCNALIMVHLSSICEELVLWSSREFGFVEISDAFSTGSSIMPQKKNPDVAELIRGKSGRVTGDLVSILMMLKSLPLAYNKDMQEDKEPFFDSVDSVLSSLSVLGSMLGEVSINSSKMELSVKHDFSNATDLADYLVVSGIPFRDAHEITGKIVKYCVSKEKWLLDCTLDELRQFSTLIEEDIFKILQIENVVARRDSYGGTSHSEVDRQLEEAQRRIAENERWAEDSMKEYAIDETALFTT